MLPSRRCIPGRMKPRMASPGLALDSDYQPEGFYSSAETAAQQSREQLKVNLKNLGAESFHPLKKPPSGYKISNNLVNKFTHLEVNKVGIIFA